MSDLDLLKIRSQLSKSQISLIYLLDNKIKTKQCKITMLPKGVIAEIFIWAIVEPFKLSKKCNWNDGE